MEVETSGTIVLAVVAGEDATADGQIDRAVETGATRLLVDLDRARAITTPGLNALLRARQQLLERNGKIAIVVSPRLRRLFELICFDRRFLLAGDRLEAIQLLGLTRPRGRDGFVPRTRRAA